MIEFDEATHKYKVNGEEYPSVTEILGALNSLQAPVNKEVLDYAAARGTAVHEACEAIDYGTDMEIDPEIVGYVKGYLEFLRDYKPTWYGIEDIVFDRAQRFAGTLDRYGVIDRVPTVLDIKTNTSPTAINYISVCAQTAAYALAKGLQPFGKSTQRYALYLKKDGSYRLFDCNEYETKKGFSGFELFLRLCGITNQIKGILRKKDDKNA